MSLGGYNMSTKKKIEKELEKENIIKEIKKAQTDVAVAEKFFQFVSDPELVDVAIYNLEAKKSRYRYLIKIAKEKGIEQLELEVVADNDRAIALYKKIGFEKMGTFPHNMKYKDGTYADAYWMVKIL